jgi:hypothetical protein
MRKEFKIEDIKFVHTKDELAFQEVVDEMANANTIAIITYNISEKQHYLLDCVKNAPDTAEIKIITNIPSRWETYFGAKYSEIAHKKIMVYLTSLNPEELGNRASVYFNFNNHGKIIMTDKVAYIGSANFSEESGKNIEFGFITRDSSFLQYLLEELIPEVEAVSTDYYLYNHAPLLIEISMGNSALFNLRSELHDQAYLLNDHRGIETFYYNTYYDLLSQVTLDSIEGIVSDLKELTSEIYDAMCEILGDDAEKTSLMYALYEKMIAYADYVVDAVMNDDISELAQFNFNDRANEILEDEYAMYADEEHLNEYAERASSDAASELTELAESAEASLIGLIQVLDSIIKDVGDIINLFKTCDLRKVNPEIDNT